MKLLHRLGIFITTLPVIFLMLEVGIRLVIPQPLVPSLYRFHPIYSFFLEPNSHTVAANADYKIKIEINSLGFRGKEFNLTNSKNILVLGDSYTFGSGVEFEETYTAVLERRLKAEGNAINIINTAVPAWGTTQKLLFLQNEGNKYAPDFIIWQISEIDFDHNLQYGLHKVINDTLVYVPPTPSLRDKIRQYTNYIPYYGWLVQRSHLVSLIRRSILLAVREHSSKKDELLKNDYVKSASNPKGWLLMKALSEEMLLTARRMDVPILLVFFPSGGREIQKQGFNPAVDSLFSYLERKKCNYIDFTYIGFDSKYRYSSDGHWKPAAHALAADSLFNYIIINKNIFQ